MPLETFEKVYKRFERWFVVHAAETFPGVGLPRQQALDYVNSRSLEEIHISCWGQEADSLSTWVKTLYQNLCLDSDTLHNMADQFGQHPPMAAVH